MILDPVLPNQPPQEATVFGHFPLDDFFHSFGQTLTAQVAIPVERAEALVSGNLSRGYAAVARHAREIGIPVPLAISLATQESGGNCRAHSWAGARGVLQVEPYTAEKDGFDPHRLYECDYGAIAGLTEMKHLIEADGGVTCHAVSRYYGSDAYLRHFRGACAPYGRQVLARAQRIERSFYAVYNGPIYGHRRHRRVA